MIESLYPMLGMIIPTYFSDQTPEGIIRELFAMTLCHLDHYLPLAQVEVVIDGDQRALPIIRELGASLDQPFDLVVLEENQGKLGAIRAGLERLYERWPNTEAAVIRDCDGDHGSEALPSFMRLSQELKSASNGLYMIAGARTSRHHPMGWMRGELETILDAVTIDALAFSLAKQNRLLDLTYCATQRAVPDISSGYKLYSRELVQHIFFTQTNTACLSPYDYDHLAPETAPFVEAMLQGALYGEIERSTFNGQPTTSFGEFEHAHLYGRLLAWVWTRLDVPLDVGLQMYDNHAAPSLLLTTENGIQAVEAVRQRAADIIQVGEPEMRFRKRRRRSFV